MNEPNPNLMLVNKVYTRWNAFRIIPDHHGSSSVSSEIQLSAPSKWTRLTSQWMNHFNLSKHLPIHSINTTLTNWVRGALGLRDVVKRILGSRSVAPAYSSSMMLLGTATEQPTMRSATKKIKKWRWGRRIRQNLPGPGRRGRSRGGGRAPRCEARWG